MKKRVLSLMLALVMVLALCPVSVFAADSDFVIKNGVLTKYKGSGGAVTIPSGVTEIGNGVFSYCHGLTSVTIPNSVTKIGERAFAECDNLTSVTIPNSVTEIGMGAFYYCTSLTSVTIGSGVTEIGRNVFSECYALTSVTIPKSVTKIEASAFSVCTSLTDVTFLSSTTSITYSSFSKTPWLKAQGDFVVMNGVLYLYQGPGGNVTIPNSVTKIGNSAFSKCESLTGVTIPNSVTEIGAWTFSECESLTSVTIPDSVTKIGAYAFQDCTDLTKAIIGNGVTEIGSSAFKGCGDLESVTIGSNVTEIGYEAFFGCTSLTSVALPASVTTIGGSVFSNCTGLTSAIISKGTPRIGREAFKGCTSLTSVTIPDSVTKIDDEAFEGCKSLTDVYYGGNEAQWAAVDTGEPFYWTGNEALTSATIHCNSPMPEVPPAPTQAEQPTDPAPASTQPEQPTDSEPVSTTYTAIPTNDALRVDGVSQVPTAYKIGDSNYFQLRDVAMMLSGTKAQFSVDYDAGRQAVVIVTGEPYKPLGTELAGAAKNSAEAILGNNDIYINGEKVDFAVYKINDANFFQIRALGQALGFNVGWSAQQGMFIESDKPYDPAN